MILIVITFFNCQNESLEQIDSKPEISVTRISATEIENNKALLKVLEKFNNSEKQESNTQFSRSIYNSDYDFTIETEEANYVEYGDYHSYTFEIKRDTIGSNIENLLCTPQNGGTYKTFIVTYYLTQEERENFPPDDANELEGKVYFSEIDMDTSFLSEARGDTEQVCPPGLCCAIKFEERDATGWMAPYLAIVPCDEGNGPGGPGPDYDNSGEYPDDEYDNSGPSGGGTGGDTGSGNQDGSCIADADGNCIEGMTSPIVDDPVDDDPVDDDPVDDDPVDDGLSAEEIAFADVLDCVSLVPNLSTWLSQQSQIHGNTVNSEIQSFIQQNGCTPETQEFIQLAVEASFEGGDVDYPNKVILDSSFVAIDKVNCTYEQISQNSNFKNLIENFTGEETPNLTFKITPNLDCGSGGDIDNGCTSSSLNSNNSITISIEQGYINSNQTPTLLIAETIIHEAIHANLYLAVYNHENGNPVNIPDIDDFPAIYEKYRGIRGLQHDVMADLYVVLIAQTLQEIHPYLNDQQYIDSLAGFDFSLEQFYTYLAYTGLNGTTGQTEFLSNPENANNYNSSYYNVRANSTKEPNCN